MSSPEKLLKPMVSRMLAKKKPKPMIPVSSEKRWVNPLGPHVASNAKPWGLAYLKRQQKRYESGAQDACQRAHKTQKTKVDANPSEKPVQKVQTLSSKEPVQPKETLLYKEPVQAEPKKQSSLRVSFEELTVTKLRELAKSSGQIKGFSKLKKADLIEALCEYMGAE